MSANDQDIDALIAAERERPEPAASVKEEVAAKVAAVVGGAALLGVGLDAGAGAGAGAGISVAMKVALGMLFGGIVGGTIVAVAVPPRVEVRTREVRVEVPAANPPMPTASTQGTGGPVPAAGTEPSAPATSATSPASTGAGAAATTSTTGRDVDLSRERALVDRARSALARGDSAGALGAAEEHRRAFPRGQLAEEREVVAIQALAGAGRSEEAANRAGAFRKAYPSSLLVPIVDAALRPR